MIDEFWKSSNCINKHGLEMPDITYCQAKRRRPRELPSENVLKVKRFTIQKITELLSILFLLYTTTEYVELPDLVLSLLILFTAGRVGQSSMLT